MSKCVNLTTQKNMKFIYSDNKTLVNSQKINLFAAWYLEFSRWTVSSMRTKIKVFWWHVQVQDKKLSFVEWQQGVLGTKIRCFIIVYVCVSAYIASVCDNVRTWEIYADFERRKNSLENQVVIVKCPIKCFYVSFSVTVVGTYLVVVLAVLFTFSTI